jgi:amino acid adenylation domain-containing protein
VAGVHEAQEEFCEATAETATFPLSVAQAEVWLAQQLAPTDALFNIGGYAEISGAVDPGALTVAVRTALREASSPLARFRETSAGVRQLPGDARDAEVLFLDLTGEADPQGAALAWMEADLARPFDLAEGPLHRSAVIQLAADRVLWYSAFHHLVTDFYGAQVLKRRIAVLYSAAMSGCAAPPGSLTPWSEVLRDELEYRASDRFPRDRSYWRERLADRPEPATLSGRPPTWSRSTLSVRASMRNATMARLKELCAASGTSLVAGLFAVAALHLWRLTGARDLILGMPVNGRTSARLRRSPAFLTNVIPLRLTVDPAGSAAELIRHCGTRIREALRHCRYPSSALRTDLGVAPNEPIIHGPMLNFLPDDATCRFAGRPPPLHPFVPPAGVQDCNITLCAHGDGSEAAVQFDANASSYDRIALDAHARGFLTLLEALLEKPQAPLPQLPMMSDRERQRMLETCGGRVLPRAARTVVELFEEQAARAADAVAVEHGEETLTYSQLDQRTNQLARYLLDQGVGLDQVVGVCLERGLDMVVALLGILKAGGAYLPLDPSYPRERLQQMVADAAPQVVLTETELAAILPATDAKLIALDEELAQIAGSSGQDLAASGPGPENLVYVIHTSGSTGRPKGTAMRHRSMVNLIEWHRDVFGPGEGRRVLQFAALSFDVAFQEIFSTLCTGGTLVLLDEWVRRDPNALTELLRQRSIDRLFIPPLMLQSIAAHAGSGAEMPSSLKDVITAGEPLRIGAEIREFFRRLAGCRLHNHYGPTETHVVTALTLDSDPQEWPDLPSIGRPIANTRLYVLDSQMQPVPIGVSGELYIGGANVARGYLNRPDLTAQRFIADPYSTEPQARLYKTGDLGRWRADGTLEYLGRNDEQIKLRGFRIEPGEIETRLARQPQVREAVVVAREDAPGEKRLVAYVTAREEGVCPSAEELWAYLRGMVPEHMVPSAFMVLDELPVTPSGKLDRRALPVPPDRLQAFREGPQTATEIRLAAIWSEVLRAPLIGRSDDFFALGGHSLLALQVVAGIRDVFHIELPLKELFDQPTLQSLAERVDRVLAAGGAQSFAPVVPVQWTGPAPLSYSQERMWLIQSLNPTNTAYNMGVVLWLRGDLDVTAARDSFDELIARQEVLRSRVQVSDEEPRQVVEPARPGMLRFTDLRPHPDAESEALRRANDDLRTTFDLRRGPLFRSQLLQTAERTFLLSMALHHIAGDQWSLGVFGRELSALYNRRRGRDIAPLEPLPISYRDFAHWERSGGRATQTEGQLQFWRRQLADLPTVDLPIDRPRPRLWTMNGSFHQRQIPPELLAAVGRLARNSGSTLFMTFLAAYAALLQRISGQSDLPIGVPVANRTLSAVEGLIGVFVNTVIIRADAGGDPAFRELLARVRRTALDAFANQDVSFDRLVQEVAHRSDRSHAPLAQVLFNVLNAPMHGIELDGVSWEPAVLDRGGAQFELSFTIDTEITHSLTVEYNTDLFERGTVERLTEQYLELLQSAASAPETRLSRLAMLPAAQWATLQRWNDTAVQLSPATFPDLFAAQAARSPGRIAISFDGKGMTYGDLDTRAAGLAGLLRRAGARRGERVAVCIRRSPELLVSLLAVQKSGGAYVPLDPDFPPERLKYMLGDSGARVVLTCGPLPEGLTLPQGVTSIDLATASPVFGQEAADGPMPQDAAYVLYTSGSTGRPKGVVVSHGALSNFLQSMRVMPGLSESDAIAAVTTVSFDIAGLELYLPLLVGARIELVAREVAGDGAALARLLDSVGITVMQATPATWRLLIDAGWRGSPRLKALCGGEALSRRLADEILERVAELWNLYGPTETTIWSTLQRIERGSQAVSIGRPIANTRIHVVDDSGAIAPIGVVGEICIAGAGVADGYHGLPALTAERFITDSHSGVPGGRLYRTGDRGRWGADGKLYHEGRRDHQVKLRGFRIELGEIEQALTSHPAVKQALVAVREAGPEDPRLVAYVTVADGEEVIVSELRRHLRGLLPDYMIPSMVMPLLSLPLSPNGKLDRAALPDPFAAPRREEAADELPPSGLERQLAQIWMSELKVGHVGRSDNFFELGGYSLLALRVAQQLERCTGRHLDPRALFFHDLREVAEMLEQDPAAGADAR